MPEQEYDVVVIGGGPAGLTAGMYASRGGLTAILLEKGAKGGPYAVTEEIENFPGFPEGVKTEKLMDDLRAQAERFGLEFRPFTAVAGLTANGNRLTVGLEDETEITARAVIVATGASPSKLGAVGETEYTGKGVSYCATCDGPLFRDKKILVIGGGNAAIEEAVALARYCSKITVVHRRDKLRAVDVLEKRARANPKIDFRFNAELKEIRGDMLVNEAVLKDVVTGEETTVQTDGVFIFVGTSPVTGFLPENVKRDERGYLVTGEDMQTSAPGVFAAGDCRKNNLKQMIWAAAEGALAAVMTEKYLEGLRDGGKGSVSHD